MIKENLYEGAVADDAPVPQMALPRDVSSEVLAKGLQQVGANLDSAVMEGVRMEDARKEFEAGMMIDACADGVKAQVEAGLQAADGSDESFFDKHGQLRQGKVEGLRNEVMKRLGSVGASIADPQVRSRVAAKAQHTEKEILSSLQETWERVNRQKTETAWKDRYDLAVARGQYDEAAGLLDRGVELNMFSKDRAEIMRLGLKERAFKEEQDGLMQQVLATVPDSAAFAALYDDPGFRKKLSPENQLKLEQLAARMPVDVPQQRVREVKGRDGSTRLEAEPREAPRGMPRGLVGVWNKYNGDFDSVEAKEEVRGHLLTYLRGLVQHADDPAELEQAKAVCKVYGHSAEFASQVVGQLRKEIDGTAAFNAREAVKAFRGQGRYFRPKGSIYLEELRARFDELTGKERSDEENKEYKVLSEKIAKWEGYDKAETEKAERAIFAKFDQWILRNPNANYMQQARAFYDFCDAHSQEDSLALDVDQMAEEAAGMFERDLLAEREKRKQAGIDLRADIKVAERMREDAEEARDKAAAEEADAEAGESMVEVSLVSEVGATNGWAGNATERILYVPKGHALAGKDVVLQTPADVEADKVKVVEHANCSAPMMSQKLRRDMGLLKNPYDTITFEGGQGRLSQGGFMATAKRARSLGGLAPYYRAFVDAARRNDLDPNLLMAIAMHETGRGTSSAFRNKKNAMGVSDRRGPVTFRSVEQSIYYMAEQLRRNYVGKGLTTIEQIGRKYAPVGAGNDPKGLNKHWVTGVARYMDELTK